MILRDSIHDATTVKEVLSGLIRRSDSYSKTREEILMELNFIVEDVEKSINRMDSEMEKAFS